jgi:uncharacterized protein YdbL (DUF1318 family)
MNRSRNPSTWLAMFPVLLTFFGCLPSTVSAADDASRLEELRRAGAVGERYDGMAMVHATGADAAVKTLVDQVNAKRRAIYDAQAKAEGAPSQEVGKVYAQQIYGKAPAGTWFLGEDGKWVQKR